MHTSKVEEAEVVSNNAYILFYQKQIKGQGGQSSSSSSSSSSTTSSSQEHWVYRMPDFNYKHKLTKAQQQQQNLKAVTTGASNTIKKTVPETKAVEVKTETEVKTEVKSEEPAKNDIKNEDTEEEIPPPVDKNDVD